LIDDPQKEHICEETGEEIILVIKTIPVEVLVS
jgi:hypothetical protein